MKKITTHKIKHDSGSLEYEQFLATLKYQQISCLAATAAVKQVYSAMSEIWGHVRHSGLYGTGSVPFRTVINLIVEVDFQQRASCGTVFTVPGTSGLRFLLWQIWF